MARLYLVRHGKAGAGFGEDPDPGLDATGRAEADAMARELAPLGPLPIVASPLRRTRETAAPLERLWGTAARIEPRVGEIPSDGIALEARAPWLTGVMTRPWREIDPALRRWRDDVVAALTSLTGDTVVVTHFVAINAAVSVAQGDERVRVFSPANCSVTVLDAADGKLTVVRLGAEGESRVL
jgi:broad specificity phosphatase PhoE